ncbi:MAG: hypothetical protein ACRDHM_09350 [Actinomycetota bacterium]
MEANEQVSGENAGTTWRISRREALRRGALLGAVVWSSPVLQTVTMRPAHAASPPAVPKYMTGGGKIKCGSKTMEIKGDASGTFLTSGFELHCDTSEPSNLVVQVHAKQASQTFTLTSLTSANCFDSAAIDPNPPGATFDTFEGAGVGTLGNGPTAEDATIEFTFTDAGEPGDQDTASIKIFDSNGDLVFECSGTLDGGNHQAHG